MRLLGSTRNDMEPKKLAPHEQRATIQYAYFNKRNVSANVFLEETLIHREITTVFN